MPRKIPRPKKSKSSHNILEVRRRSSDDHSGESLGGGSDALSSIQSLIEEKIHEVWCDDEVHRERGGRGRGGGGE